MSENYNMVEVKRRDGILSMSSLFICTVYEDIKNYDDYTILALNIEKNAPLNPPDASGGLVIVKFS